MSAKFSIILQTLCCLAVLASIVPLEGEISGKPAGVRTAIELLSKRSPATQLLIENGLKSVARS
ncbi:MAG: hypothetical protein NW216_14390 [Hyphomicrobium sp.]|nr:hypothetical protein [Hyphomicrobium sp.]